MSPALTGVIGAFATGSYTVTRTAAGATALGRYTAGSTSSFDIAASVQPVSGRDLLALPEGLRADETRIVYTTTELRALTSASDTDAITIDGETWDVVRVERWQAFGGTHYRALAARRAGAR